MLISKVDKAKCPLQHNNSIIVTTCWVFKHRMFCLSVCLSLCCACVRVWITGQCYTQTKGNHMILSDPSNQFGITLCSLKSTWCHFIRWWNIETVSLHSCHCQQVSEILCTGKSRLSINGWFHGTPVGRPAPSHEAPLQYWSPMPMEVGLMAINLLEGKITSFLLLCIPL